MHFYVNFEEVFRQCSRSLKCHFGALHLVKIALLSHKSYIRGRDLVRVGRPSGAVVGLSWSKDPPLLCRPWKRNHIITKAGKNVGSQREVPYRTSVRWLSFFSSPTITIASSLILFSKLRFIPLDCLGWQHGWYPGEHVRWSLQNSGVLRLAQAENLIILEMEVTFNLSVIFSATFLPCLKLLWLIVMAVVLSICTFLWLKLYCVYFQSEVNLNIVVYTGKELGALNLIYLASVFVRSTIFFVFSFAWTSSDKSLFLVLIGQSSS